MKFCRFYSALAFNLKNRSKQVHAPAAEVIGMTFKQMVNNDEVKSSLTTDVNFTDKVYLSLFIGGKDLLSS